VPQPTTAGDAVADLHALLTAAGEAGPFVLVGHSVAHKLTSLFWSRIFSHRFEHEDDESDPTKR